jgi:hypothetical protein
VLGWSLIQKSHNKCCVSEYDREASIMRRPWPTRGCYAMGGGWGKDWTEVISPLQIPDPLLPEKEPWHRMNKTDKTFT